jgi:hypothetical protein
VENESQYMARKRREIALLDSCLGAPLAPAVARSAAEAIDTKFKLAAALRAERAMQSWPLSETAHPTIAHWHSGAFKFSFGYQRADLTICGPPIYPALASRVTPAHTIYTGAGMSAIASVLTAALRVRSRASVFLPRGAYSETRELLERFGDRALIETWGHVSRRDRRAISILWIDSCVPSAFSDFKAMPAGDFDLVVLDTTCFSHGSRRIVQVVDWAQAAHLPIALVRSHAKLDCLGVEYGRLGSIDYLWDKRDRRHVWMKRLLAETREAIRLFGTAALPSHFPPFVGSPAYDVCTAQRTAAILRNTRRAARRLARACGKDAVGTYQHNLYLTLAPATWRNAAAVWRAADELCELLSQQNLPVKHAGSFGFDFTALDSFVDPISARQVLRIAPGDLPTETVDRIVDAIADHWGSHEPASKGDYSRSRASPRATVASAAASRASE